MAPNRLSALDASFLDVETASAHMHVGWAAAFDPPDERPAPSFEQLRDHIARRLQRAPRYRQRLAGVPLGLARPVVGGRRPLRHHAPRPAGRVRAASDELAGSVLSTPLSRERPLWELWIADRLDDGRIGVVCKAHHCMVDGIAAVELATVLLDMEPERPTGSAGRLDDRGEPPGQARRLVDGLVDVGARPAGAGRLGSGAARLAAQASRPAHAARAGALVQLAHPGEPARCAERADLARIARWRRSPARWTSCAPSGAATAARSTTSCSRRRRAACAATSSATASGPARLKAMVPVNVRGDDAAGELGNRISFIFVELPCDEPAREQRLRAITLATGARQDAPGSPREPRPCWTSPPRRRPCVQRAMSKLVASPRTFNVVVSNIPGPQPPMWMLGCRLREAYPIVPLADRHALSIGFTSVDGGAFFGIYADRDANQDAELLARDIGDELDELQQLAPARTRRRRATPVAT